MSTLTSPASQDPKRPLVNGFNAVTLAALIGIALFGAYWMYATFSVLIFEDAYITFQYAANLADGKGLVFNEGERVLGTTAPLYALTLGFLGWLGFSIEQVADLIFVGSLAGVGIMGGIILRRSGAPLIALLFATIVAAGGPGMQRYIGMETPMVSVLLFAAMFAAHSRRETLASVFIALAFLTRYDCAPFAIAFFAFVTIRDRRIPWKNGLTAVAIVTPWLVFSQIYYGSIFPHTLGAKTGDTAFMDYLKLQPHRQLKFLWHFGSSAGLPTSVAPYVKWTLMVGAISGMVLGARKWPLATLLWVFPIGLLLTYAKIGPNADFVWYMGPAMLLLLLLVALGLSALARLLRLHVVVGAAAGLMTIASVPAIPGHFRVHADANLEVPGYHTRVHGYAHIGDWLIEAEFTDLPLATFEPGYFCFRTKNPAVDMAGLVTKGIRFHGAIEQRTPIEEIIETFDPKLIIASSGRRIDGFVPVHVGSVKFHLQMERALYEERFDHIVATLRTAGSGPAAEIQSPFAYDNLGGDDFSRWADDGGIVGRAGDPFGIRFPGRPAGTPSMFVERHEFGAESPTFVIDFDRIDFDFAARAGRQCFVELVVDEAVVASVPGSIEGDDMVATSGSIDLGAWRGKTARVRFVHWDRYEERVALDRVASAIDSERQVMDDFDGQREQGQPGEDLWVETFGEGAKSTREIALALGPQFMANGDMAHSYGIMGRTKQVSRPFQIEHDELRFLFHDYTRRKGHVRLIVNGEVVRQLDSSKFRRTYAVSWDVAEFRGEEATLRITDNSSDADRWVGIDELLQATR